jgi:hypothetical protein
MAEERDFTDAALDAAFESMRASTELAAQGLIDHSARPKGLARVLREALPQRGEEQGGRSSHLRGRRVHPLRRARAAGLHGRPVLERQAPPEQPLRRFGADYERWKKGQTEAALEGTPLSILSTIIPPILTPSEVKEFEAVHVRTAEQLVEVPDTLGKKFLGFQETKRKVQKYLDMLDAAAPQEHLRAELEDRDMRIQAQEDRIRSLEQRLEATAGPGASRPSLTEDFAAAAEQAEAGTKRPKAKAKR